VVPYPRGAQRAGRLLGARLAARGPGGQHPRGGEQRNEQRPHPTQCTVAA
jgi:hypothetical protein